MKLRLLASCIPFFALGALHLSATESQDGPNPPSSGPTPKKMCRNNCTGETKERPTEGCPNGWTEYAATESVHYTFGIGTATYQGRDSFVNQDLSRRVPAFEGYMPPSTDEAPFASSLQSEWDERNLRPVVLGLVTDEITEETFTPAALQLYGGNAGSAWVKRDAQGNLRQVLSDQYLTDISSSGGELIIRNYLRAGIGALDSGTGLYPLPQAEDAAMRSIIISRPDPEALDTVDILVTDRSSSRTSPKVTGLRWVRSETQSPATVTWILTRHNGDPEIVDPHHENKLVKIDLGDGVMQRTRTLSEAGFGGTLVTMSETSEKYRDLGDGTLRIVERVEAPGRPEELTTTYTYTDLTGTGVVGPTGSIPAPPPGKSFNRLIGARLRSLSRTDGYWEEYRYQYNAAAGIMLTEKWSPWKNSTSGQKGSSRYQSITLEGGSRTVIEKVGNQVISNEHETLTVAPDGTRTLRTERRSGTDTAPLITEHAYFSDTAQEPFKGRIQYTRHPDGTITRYTYSHAPDVTDTSLTAVKTVIEKGVADVAEFAPAATGPVPALSEGTRTETLTNSFERDISKKTSDIASGLVLEEWVVAEVDDVGRPTSIIHNSDPPVVDEEHPENNRPGDFETFIYACCGVQEHRGRDGSVTEYTRDASGRIEKTEVTLGSKTTTTNYVYGSESVGGRDCPKTTVTESLTAQEIPLDEEEQPLYPIVRFVSESVSDLRGQTIISRSPDANGNENPEVTTYLQDVASRTRSSTGPDGIMTTTVSYADGRTHTSLSTAGGTPVTPLTSYDYETHQINGGGIKTTIQKSHGGSTLSTAASLEDLAGRTFQAERPGHDGALLVSTTIFDERGRAVSETRDGQPATRRILNLMGEVVESWTDTNGDNEFDDTAVEGVRDACQKSQSDYVTEDGQVCERTRQWVRDDSDTDILVSTSFRSTDGRYQKSIPLNGPVTVTISTKPLDGNASRETRTYITQNTYLTQATTVTLGNDGTTTTLQVNKDTAGDAVTTASSVADLEGRITESVGERGLITRFTNFTGVGQPLKTTHSDGTYTVTTLDSAARPITVETFDAQQALISTVNTTYHPHGQPAANWGTNTNPTFRLYDIEGRLVELRTYRSDDLTLAPTASTPGYDATTWAYEPATGLLLSKRYADGKGPDYAYTGDGRLQIRTWARGVTTTYGYDNANRLVSTDYSDTTPDVTITYDRLGRQVVQSNGVAKSNFAYDPATLALDNETISYDLDGDSTPELARVLDRSIDGVGRESGWQIKNGTAVENEVTYGYSATNGRLASVTSPAGAFAYSYVANSSLTATVTGPVHAVVNSWEQNRNVLALKENKVGTNTISSFGYAVNPLGQRVSVGQAGSAFDSVREVAWLYDMLGQVVSADSSITGHDRAYQYDAIGNRLKSADSLTLPTTNNYNANELNQYDSVGSLSPAYDHDGNATSYPLPADPNNLSAMTWDAENRLISAIVDGVTVTYRYDAQSRRVSRDVGTSSTTLYLYDAWNPIAEYSYQSTSLTIQNSFTWGTDLSGSTQGAGGVGGLLAVTEHDGSAAESYFPTFDGNGNISEYLDDLAAVVAHYEYDPFGRTLLASGAKAADFAHRFSTKPLDSATGLYYYGYRWFDPLTGRWPSCDPMEEAGAVNLYGLIGNDSVNNVDLLGLLILPFGPGINPLPPSIEDIRRAFYNGVASRAEIAGNPLAQKLLKQWVWQKGDLTLTEQEFHDNFGPWSLSLLHDPQFSLDLNKNCSSGSESSFSGTYKVLRPSFLGRTLGKYWVYMKVEVGCCLCDDMAGGSPLVRPSILTSSDIRWRAEGLMWGEDRYDFNKGNRPPEDEEQVRNMRWANLIPFIGKDFEIATPEIKLTEDRACGESSQPKIDWSSGTTHGIF